MHPTNPFGHRPSSAYLIAISNSLHLWYKSPETAGRQSKSRTLKRRFDPQRIKSSRNRKAPHAPHEPVRAPPVQRVPKWDQIIIFNPLDLQYNSPDIGERRMCLTCRLGKPLSSELGTCKTVQARFWPWLSGKSPFFKKVVLFSLGSGEGVVCERNRDRSRTTTPAGGLRL